MTDTASNSWLDKILNTGLSLVDSFTGKISAANSPTAQPKATNWQPILIAGGIAAATILALALFRK